ncbi:MAG TPA: efflux transporter outer membrane subunit [Myxococcota bacterium]|jgi:NodT family efflux transporter outer membrane factor (OMF) lipoprotein|nr:efflux transporter outer membrane subunit [Myxococcota bacterium]
MVGPNFARPEAPVSPSWLESGDPHLQGDTTRIERWWDVFGDPTLSHLVELAYAQNLTLRTAGLRVVQAQARRAIAIGEFFPQEQALGGSYANELRSKNAFSGAVGEREFVTWRAGFDAAWELDLWGKFRRGIEAADADLLGAVATFEDVLVSLEAEVATTYIQIRTLEEQLSVARDNVRVQEDGLRIARVRFEAGGTSELDVKQAETQLRDTEATIPQLEIQLRQAVDSLCVLLGLPPQELAALIGSGGGMVPEVPPSVAVGLPAELLRRRPDVRAAELSAAAQSARIGVAAAELLPAFTISGSVGLSAEKAKDFFTGRSFEAVGGPSFSWPVLNYGRLVNDVRLQDATFQETLTNYANTVLRAQSEVEDAVVGYLRGGERVEQLSESVEAAHRAVDLSVIQYREGAADFTSVLTSQQQALREDDLLASSRGDVALSVVALYKALGGGWELHRGDDFVPAETREAMRARTRWGGLIQPEERAADVEKARADSGPEAEPRPWWKGRWWWPKW